MQSSFVPFLLWIAFIYFWNCGILLGESSEVVVQPPVAKRVPLVQSMFGESWVDYYAWFRNKSDPEVLEYLQAENDYGNHVTQHLQSLQQDLYNEFMSIENEEQPSQQMIEVGDYYYYSKYLPNQTYEVWYRQPKNHPEQEQVVPDCNQLAESCSEKYNSSYFALGVIAVSPNNELLAYTVDIVGNERFILNINNMTANVTLNDDLRNVYYSVQWANDSRTLFYNLLDQQSAQAL